MTVKVAMSDEEFARIKFERLMQLNGFSTSKKDDKETYRAVEVQDMWMAYRAGFQAGRGSAAGTGEL